MRNKISSNFNKYTKSETLIANYILSHDISKNSIIDLAKEIGVGEATILRFCKKIGYSGFYEFKIEYIKSESLHIKPETTTFFSEELLKILETQQNISDPNNYIQAAHIIHNSSDLFVLGIGSSETSAVDLGHQLQKRGYMTQIIQSKSSIDVSVNMISKLTTILVFSPRGHDTNVINYVKTAKLKGAKIIVFSEYLDTPLTQSSDLVIQTVSSLDHTDTNSLTTKFSQLISIFHLLHVCDQTTN